MIGKKPKKKVTKKTKLTFYIHPQNRNSWILFFVCNFFMSRFNMEKPVPFYYCTVQSVHFVYLFDEIRLQVI